MAMRKQVGMLAAIGRTHEEKVVFATTQKCHPSSLLIGEARAMVFRMQEALKLHFPYCIFEGYNNVVISNINGSTYNWEISNSRLGVLAIGDIPPSVLCNSLEWIAT
ncbi:hypothetical protein PanWU01x14_246120 [Parasponia andersonii]|uniref:RNase H type-1 domain-containing protein n=1 Tax=Parasponia andersonii TaxID=3476 RepID=A0A2P5BEL2_PARAD|nr:hypothetical protein PanWU01x14_246120 [Parasponia andersonii]